MPACNPFCVAPTGDQCGEAVTWCPDEGAIYWTDVNRFLVHRMRPGENSVSSWYFDEPCVALYRTDKPGTLLLALGSRIIQWQPATDTRADFGFQLHGWPGVRLNEGRPGPGGEVWIGSMANNVAPDGAPGHAEGDRGELYRVSAGQATLVKGGIGVSNTLCFSPDRRYLYFGDTHKNVIWRFDYDADSGHVHNERVFSDGFERGRPDGSTTDAEGYLWNCRFGGGCLVRVSPAGKVDRIVDMPCTNITTCEFGGEDLATLYISTAAINAPGFERLAGSLFALEPGVAGSEPCYAHLAGGSE